ncbi:MAG: hypothetical protein ACLP6G_19500 [Terriglobales bacterium]
MRTTKFVLGMLLLLGVQAVVAQETQAPPKVLSVIREFLKPGKGGMAHQKTESLFVEAFSHAKWPTHYLAVDSLSGKPRSLFLVGYDSFDAWEKDTNAARKNSALSAALDHANEVDGELLSEVNMATFVYNEEYSYHSAVDIAHMRYFEISLFHVRPGHQKEWDDLVKMVNAAYAKAMPDTHWAAYEAAYGQPGDTYVFFTPLKSMAEIDSEFMANKKFEAAMGEDGMKKLGELSAASIESSETNLFAFNPRISYVGDDWIKADPDFWKPKAAKASAGAEKKTGEKPAAKP